MPEYSLLTDWWFSGFTLFSGLQLLLPFLILMLTIPGFPTGWILSFLEQLLLGKSEVFQEAALSLRALAPAASPVSPSSFQERIYLESKNSLPAVHFCFQGPFTMCALSLLILTARWYCSHFLLFFFSHAPCPDSIMRNICIQDPPVSAFYVIGGTLELQMCATKPSFLWVSEDLNSGPNACAANALS